jgi:hypothetical protein
VARPLPLQVKGTNALKARRGSDRKKIAVRGGGVETNVESRVSVKACIKPWIPAIGTGPFIAAQCIKLSIQLPSTFT